MAGRLADKARSLSAAGKRPFIIPTGASDDIGCWGYVAAALELQRDLNLAGIKPVGIYTATGSGGTQAGLTAGAQLFGLGCPVTGVAVCDDKSYFQRKVLKDIRAWQQRYVDFPAVASLAIDALDIRVLDAYIGPGYALADDEVFDTIIWLARKEGVLLDPVYTGKTFYGLVSEIKSGRIPKGSDVVFVHTGGVFGVFPDRERLTLRARQVS